MALFLERFFYSSFSESSTTNLNMAIIRNFLVSTLFNCLLFAAFSVQANTSFSSRIDVYKQFNAEKILPRNVSVWLPASYFSSPQKRFSVIYAQDGQNLFFPEFTYAGVTWGIEDTITRLNRAGKINDVIVVGISSTKNRRLEYYPQGSTQYVSEQTRKNLASHPQGPPRGDAYMAFIVEKLKPFIDGQYRTLADRENTFLLGSSMGGVISLYGAIRYPDVFGAAACLSTHWPLNHFIQASSVAAEDELAKAYIRYIKQNLPSASAGLRLYFDYGDQGVDAMYEPYQRQIDTLLRERNYKQGEQWVSRFFPGGNHNEKSWGERLDIPLQFLLKK